MFRLSYFSRPDVLNFQKKYLPRQQESARTLYSSWGKCPLTHESWQGKKSDFILKQIGRLVWFARDQSSTTRP
ncbi:hypothetical protein RUM44_004721 [Polyplax serrata]|uniref:Uncharacterized protein n=1 Tax=Polyplax serrata TaxID=468196 RepID=A0ABR1B5D3_POLSC